MLSNPTNKLRNPLAAAHALHALKQRRGEAAAAEQMTVQEVEVPAGETVDFSQSVVHRRCVESASSGKEGLLVTKVADVWATARDHDGIRDQVEMPLDEIAADRRQANQRAHGGIVTRSGRAGAVVAEEPGPGVLARTGEDYVGMGGGLLGERGDVKPAQSDEDPTPAVPIGDFGVVAGIKISGQGRQAERRKERVLDGTKERTCGIG